MRRPCTQGQTLSEKHSRILHYLSQNRQIIDKYVFTTSNDSYPTPNSHAMFFLNLPLSVGCKKSHMGKCWWELVMQLSTRATFRPSIQQVFNKEQLSLVGHGCQSEIKSSTRGYLPTCLLQELRCQWEKRWETCPHLHNPKLIHSIALYTLSSGQALNLSITGLTH